jgi:hypothetical protein
MYEQEDNTELILMCGRSQLQHCAAWPCSSSKDNRPRPPPPPTDLDCCPPIPGREIPKQVTGRRGAAEWPLRSPDFATLYCSSGETCLCRQSRKHGWSKEQVKGRIFQYQCFNAAKSSTPCLHLFRKCTQNIEQFEQLLWFIWVTKSRLWISGLLCLEIWRRVVWQKVTNIFRGRKDLLSQFSGRPKEWNMVKTYGCVRR